LYYNGFKSAFKIIKKETDIEVFSCSKNSRLNKLIKFIDFRDLVANEEKD